MKKYSKRPILLVLLLTMFAVGMHGAANVSPVNTPPPAETPVVDPDNVVLRWSAGPDDVSFRVHVGAPTLVQRANIGREELVLTDLDPDTYYQWRVDAYGEDRRLVGDRGEVWTFRTGPADPRKTHTPVPVHGSAVETEVDNILSWSAGADAKAYNIYFGKDSTPDEGELRGNTVDLSYNAGILETNTQYYWKIDTIVDDEGTVVPGRVWTFRTGYELVEYENDKTVLFADNFESSAAEAAPNFWERANEQIKLAVVNGRAGKSLGMSGSGWIERKINTEDMRDIQVSYHQNLSGFGSGESFSLQWSSDGVAWHTVQTSQSGSFSDDPIVVNLETDASNQSDFQIRFVSNTAGTDAVALLDSVVVSGVYSPFVPERDPEHDIEGARVIFLGDSVTSNNGSLRDRAGRIHWTDILQERFDLDMLSAHAYDLNDHSLESRLITHGKGGSRAYLGAGNNIPDYHGDDVAHPNLGGYQRLKYAFEEAEQGLHGMVLPDFVVINFGMNDHKRVWRNGESSGQSTPEDFGEHLKLIVDLCREKGVIPLLAAPHDFYQGSTDDYESYYTLYSPELFNNAEDNYSALGRYALFMDAVREVAKGSVEEGRAPVDLIDIHKAARAYDLDEFTTTGGVHLEQLGHDVYGQVIGDYLSARYGDGTLTQPPPPPPPPEPIEGNFVLSGSGLWTERTIWNRGQPPSDINRVFIRGGLEVTVSSDVGAIQRFYLGDNASTYPPGSGKLTVVSGGKLIVSEDASEVGRQRTNGSKGYLNIDGGLLQLGNETGSYTMKIGVDSEGVEATGEVVVSGGELRGKILLGSNGIAGATGDLLRISGRGGIVGSAASGGNGIEVCATGTVEYVFNDSGVAGMEFPESGGYFHTGAKIVVDGSAYTGPAASFILLDCSYFTGVPEITLQGFPQGTDWDWDATTGTFTVDTASENIGLLTPGEYLHDNVMSWTFGYSDLWGYSPMLGTVYVSLYPDAVYSVELGWLMFPHGSAETGVFYYRPDGDWIWAEESMSGLYYDYSAGNWFHVFQQEG